MSLQNQVILSLGSNQGDRLASLKAAVQRIHERAGTVVRSSRIYETPAWGFDGEPFYNLALWVHTHQSAARLLKTLLSIEKELGRARDKSKGYQSRLIDIDIIAFNDDIVERKQLQLPHPQMAQRLFVLMPLRDICPDFIHPVSGKPIAVLLAETTDKSPCTAVGNLLPPLQDLRLDTFNYIAIEGNIGAGKTTLTTKIAEDFNAKIVLERFADNPFLPKFYKDQPRYAFPLEMSFLADRYQQLSDDLAQFDLFKDFIVADYHIFKSLIFAKVTLTDDEYRLYRKLFEIIYKEMPKPDLYIYLYQNTPRLLENIRKRGRSYEQEIPAEYLENINRGYLDYIKSQTNLNILVIDVSERDFVKNQEDYLFILDQIRQKISGSN